MKDWNKCKHKWHEIEDSQWHSEYKIAVICTECYCPGEKDIKTGDVFWPTT